MNSNLQLLYKSTLSKYKKFKSRFDKNVSSGHFYELSHKAQHQIITRLKRLKRRLSNLKTQLKLALVSGALVFCLSTTPTQAQQLGPFVQNDIKNPLKPPSSPFSRNQNPTAVDIDNDGDLDVFVGDRYGRITFLQNDGSASEPFFVRQSGSYNPANGIDVGSYASPTFADLDGDGDFDMIVGQNYQYLYSPFQNMRFFENIGNLTAPNFVSGSFPNPADDIFADAYYGHPEYGDIDNDGDLDALVGGTINTTYASRETITFWRNNGSLPLPQFNRESGALNPFAIINPDYGSTLDRAAPALVDIDNDGDLDLFVGEANGTIRFFENTGNATTPTFASESTGVSNPLDGIVFYSNASPEFADLDGDGDFDIIVGTGDNESLQFILNEGNSSNPNFVLTNRLVNPFDGVDTGYDSAPTAIDVDGDGFLDVVIGQKYSSTLLYFTNNQDSSFTEQVGSTNNPFDNLLGTNYYGRSYNQPDADFADIDNDGDMDLFVASRSYNTLNYNYESRILFFRNSGSNIFVKESSPINTFQINTKFGITLGNLAPSLDSDIDAIIGINNNSGNFIFSRNDGDIDNAIFNDQPTSGPPFGNINLSPGFTSYAKPQFVDLDHDGDLDVVTGIQGGNVSGQLFFFKNNGFGNLILQASVANPFNGLDVVNDSNPAFLDFDNDGDLDALVGNNDGHIILFENQNEPPQVTAGATPLTFTEGDAPISVHPTLDITDDGNDLILGATVKIQNYVAGEDVLTFDPITNPDWNISASFETSGLNAGTLVITGLDTIYNYRTVLQSVKYENTSVNPNTVTRNIQFAVTDFDNTDPFSDSFPEPIINVDIISINSTPVVSASSAADGIYIENDTPGVIIDAGITVSDADNTSLQSATISIINNFNQAEDALVFNTQNGITGNYVSTTGVLTLSGASSVANYQTALRSVRYTNNSEDPSTAARTIEFSVYDGTDNSTPATRNVQVVAVNDAPVLSSSNSGTLNYDQNTPAILVDDLLSISDVDNANLLSVTVTINGYQSGDILDATPPSGITSNFDTGTGILLLSGSAPIADYIATVQSTTFSSTGSGTRQIEFVANDGTDNSSAYSRQIAIILPNEAPVLSSTNVGTSVNYNQSGSAILIDNQITISDVDDTFLEGLTVSINGFVNGDILTVTSPNETNTNFDTVSGVLSIMGTAPLTDYEAAMRTVAFSSSNDLGSRTIEFIVNDGDDNSNLYSRDLNIVKATLPPVVNTTPATTQVGGLVTISWCDIIEDPDNDDSELIIEVVSILSEASTSISGCDLIIDYSSVTFEGEDSIVLRATDPDGNSDENTLTITVEPIGVLPIKVYNAISPNGDGANDWWEIVNLLTPNKIELYNRWGDLVKTLTDYKNIPDNSQMDDLPSGTYFYKIESPNGEYTGYISIKK